jgi:hypothetical protein
MIATSTPSRMAPPLCRPKYFTRTTSPGSIGTTPARSSEPARSWWRIAHSPLPATELPKAPSSVHLLLRDKASWVEPQIGLNDDCFDGYPELSIEDWHKKHGLWID